MYVHTNPGSMGFTATWTGGHKPWEDAYWVTGYHDENSNICDRRELPGSHGKYGKSLVLPIKVSKRVLITADMRAMGEGRIGFDLWFTARISETGPRKMEQDYRTWEVMIMPGNGRYIYRDNPGWHRVYMGVLPEHYGIINFRGLDLTNLIRRAGVPGYDYLMAVDAGAETTMGSFTVQSYALHIAGQHPVPKPKPHHHPKPHHPKRKVITPHHPKPKKKVPHKGLTHHHGHRKVVKRKQHHNVKRRTHHGKANPRHYRPVRY